MSAPVGRAGRIIRPQSPVESNGGSRRVFCRAVRKLKGRVAVVTGAASGIGRATAALLAERGCALALVDLNEAGLAETADLVRARGRKVSLHRADVADHGDRGDHRDQRDDHRQHLACASGHRGVLSGPLATREMRA